MVQSSDHITGITGATVTVTISKAGATGAAAGGTVSQVDATNNPGLYKIVLTTTDTNTLGDLSFHCTATSADPTDFVDQVTTQIFGDTLTANTTQIAGAAVSTTTAQIGVNVVQVNAQTATAAAGVTFPSSIASPTNITAGTITTTTNLTNAPTAGDFTATMKTSLNAATPASVTGAVGSVTGSVGSVTGAVGSVTGNVGGNVTGSVGSVAGNVGGNVVGSVASVTAAVTVSGTSSLTESYAADGAAFTLAQALYGIHQFLGEHSTSGTTWTVKKRDGSTTANTWTLNDATNPTAITQTT